jgi:hypothetical protein
MNSNTSPTTKEIKISKRELGTSVHTSQETEIRTISIPSQLGQIGHISKIPNTKKKKTGRVASKHEALSLNTCTAQKR